MPKEPDHRATYKVLVGILAFPAVWMLEALLVLALAGAAAGAATLVVAPATGYVALRFADRARRFRTEARAFLLLKKHPQLGEKLKDQRRALCEEVRALVELYRAG